ncbi:MAG: hypothetical protein M1828_006330 [Chrysothrix sp. TS-e1954]|nr:MAG: hypothetical protein M1828_006330 [Chrysothrix sp. TS-e1954]
MTENSGPGSFRSMKSHLETILARGGERADFLVPLSQGMHSYSQTKLSIEDVMHFFALIFTNSFTLWTPTFDAIGICLDPFAAAANHSCDPNVITVFDGPEMQLRTLKPIAKDEEIFVSYIEITNPFRRRQHELLERYYFTCDCDVCREGPAAQQDEFVKDLLPDGEQFMQETFDRSQWTPSNMDVGANYVGNTDLFRWLGEVQHYAFDMLDKARKSKEDNIAHTLLQGILACKATELWPEERQPLPALRQELLVARMDQQKLGHAFIQAVILKVNFYEEAHSHLEQGCHPLSVINDWTIATIALAFRIDPAHAKMKEKLEGHGVNFDLVCFGSANMVKKLVGWSHGDENSFAKRVNFVVDKIGRELSGGDPVELERLSKKADQHVGMDVHDLGSTLFDRVQLDD